MTLIADLLRLPNSLPGPSNQALARVSIIEDPATPLQQMWLFSILDGRCWHLRIDFDHVSIRRQYLCDIGALVYHRLRLRSIFLELEIASETYADGG